jgi:hypothetical protein
VSEESAADNPPPGPRRTRAWKRFWQGESRAAWRVLARSEIARLRDELQLVGEPVGVKQVTANPTDYVDEVKAIVSAHLDRAESALARTGPLGSLRSWYSGAALEDAWLNIHRAGEALLMIQAPGSLIAEYVQIDASFRATVPTTDPRYVTLAHMMAEVGDVLVTKQTPDTFTAVLRSKLKAARSVSNFASDTAHETVRRWRNLLLIGGFALAALAIVVTLVHIWVPSFFSLTPSGIPRTADAIEPWEVALVGSLGGALAAVLALNGFSGYTDPAGLPIVQALLRIPTAAVTSLIGVLLMQTATLDVLKPQNGATVLAYAFFFGYAQEPLLRAIDRRAGAVLDPARNKDEPAKTVPSVIAPPSRLTAANGPKSEQPDTGGDEQTTPKSGQPDPGKAAPAAPADEQGGSPPQEPPAGG